MHTVPIHSFLVMLLTILLQSVNGQFADSIIYVSSMICQNLWMNWLRPERWILWAHSAHPNMIPILKTTMMVESHWRRIKRDFLYHFSLPCIYLLVWILVKKLAPKYYCKIDRLQLPVAHYWELHSWRKSFKREWKKCLKAQTTLPSNRDRYHPDPIC